MNISLHLCIFERATAAGYWKTTGKDKEILGSAAKIVGMKEDAPLFPIFLPPLLHAGIRALKGKEENFSSLSRVLPSPLSSSPRDGNCFRREKRDEIVIIMLQWMRLYTLGSRGSRELKTFLETRLISSRVDQKLRTKKGNTSVLKRKIGPTIVAIGAVVEAVCKGRGSGSLGRHRSSRICREFCLLFAPIDATIALDRGHDQAAIGPRS